MFSNVFAEKCLKIPKFRTLCNIFRIICCANSKLRKKTRRLSLTAVTKKGLKAEIDVMLTNCFAAKDKMVIATPFANKRQWYLNYKENCFVASGRCRIEDMDYEIHNGFGILDWGRGVWPYSHSLGVGKRRYGSRR